MSDITDLVQRYLAAWNETDAAARQAVLREVFADDAVYTDPLVSVRGRDGLDATIAAVQGQFGGLVFSLGGAVDTHHDIARFTWHLGPEGAEPVVVGFDVAVIGADGRISQVLGFLDKVPAGI
ncbi:nuclear transport factor 2 family protein [Micromonospora sp. C28SCA-DRY-2]|uniref:nuclear transport factor 2 family protein n=1 Tax=Micromonospora sp. C28SCA-DRY-2 TaxID=3059522 RepID=UPI00267511C4|nr:nuclear transport factor 2 family protein [Micromonospora sp. C28SCA-DRY-2]MDO3703211.1 nuclear transport factor 2 family protein [Micromonospora sp. C28SCA-DRY-2]